MADVVPPAESSPEREQDGVPVDFGDADTLETIAAACATKPNEPIRIRLAAQLFDPIKKYYAGWRNKTWRVEVKNADEARRTLEGVEILFDLVSLIGIEKTVAEMTKMKRRVLETR